MHRLEMKNPLSMNCSMDRQVLDCGSPLPLFPKRAAFSSRPPARQLGLLILLCALAGCKTYSPSVYVAPRVTGRVLDQQTRLPLQGVRVMHITSEESPPSQDSPKGGRQLDQTPMGRSGADGTFELASQRSLSLLQQGGWYSVTLAFEHARYERFVTSYTLANSTNTAKGEPLVNTGDILLIPRTK